MPEMNQDTASAPRSAAARDDNLQGMEFLETLPKRIVFTYMPLLLILFVLLFPF